MADHDNTVAQIVIAATYPTEIAARADYERLVELRRSPALQHAHAALLVRDDKDLRIEQHSFDTMDTAGFGTVIGIVAGAALAAVFPPLGLAVAAAALAGGVGGGLLGGVVGAAVGHLEGEVSRADLDAVGGVLRSGQAALLVAADAEFAARVRAEMVETTAVITVDVTGENLAEAYQAVSRVLESSDVAAAHALAAAEPDVAMLLRYAQRTDLADDLTEAQSAQLQSIAADLAGELQQHAPSHAEHAAIDRGARVVADLAMAHTGDDELQRLAASLGEADDLARRFYASAARGSRPPVPPKDAIERVRAYASDAVQQQQTQDLLERNGATPVEKGAVTRALHTIVDVAGRLSADVDAAVARTNEALDI